MDKSSSSTTNITNREGQTWVRYVDLLMSKTPSRNSTRRCSRCRRCSCTKSTKPKCPTMKAFKEMKPRVRLPISNKILKEIQSVIQAHKLPNGTEITHFSCQQRRDKPIRCIYHTAHANCPGITCSLPIIGNTGNICFASTSTKHQSTAVINIKAFYPPTFPPMNRASEISSTSTNFSGIVSENRLNFEHAIIIPGLKGQSQSDKLIRNDCDRWQNASQDISSPSLEIPLPRDISELVPGNLLTPDYTEYLNLADSKSASDYVNLEKIKSISEYLDLENSKPISEYLILENSKSVSEYIHLKGRNSIDGPYDNEFSRDLMNYFNDDTSGSEFEKNLIIEDKNNIIICDKSLWEAAPREAVIKSTTKCPVAIYEDIPAALLKPNYSDYLDLDKMDPLVQCDDQFIQDLLFYPHNGKFGGKFKIYGSKEIWHQKRPKKWRSH